MELFRCSVAGPALDKIASFARRVRCGLLLQSTVLLHNIPRFSTTSRLLRSSRASHMLPTRLLAPTPPPRAEFATYQQTAARSDHGALLCLQRATHLHDLPISAASQLLVPPLLSAPASSGTPFVYIQVLQQQLVN